MGKLITAVKWFAYGIGLGLLFAPRSGRETRQQIAQSISTAISGAMSSASQTMGQATGRTGQSGDQSATTTQQSSDRLNQASYNVQESTTPSSTTFGSGPV